MTTLDEYAPKATFRFCIFGRAKVGKTALAAQLARIWKLHYIDLEDGVKTALNPAILDPQYRKNINLFPIPSRQSAPMGIETLLKLVSGKPCLICWTHGKVACPACSKVPGAVNNRLCLPELTPNDCLVIDSSTQLSADANSAAVAFIFREADTPDQFVLDKDTGGKNFKYPMAVSFMLDRIFGYLQTATNFNSVVISHEVMTEKLKDTGHVVKLGENQPNTGEELIFPAAGSRNFSRQFGRYFDALIHLDIVNRKHRASSSTIYSPNVQTGSRLPFNIEDMKDAAGNQLFPFDAIVKLVETAKGQGTTNERRPDQATVKAIFTPV